MPASSNIHSHSHTYIPKTVTKEASLQPSTKEVSVANSAAKSGELKNAARPSHQQKPPPHGSEMPFQFGAVPENIMDSPIPKLDYPVLTPNSNKSSATPEKSAPQKQTHTEESASQEKPKAGYTEASIEESLQFFLGDDYKKSSSPTSHYHPDHPFSILNDLPPNNTERMGGHPNSHAQAHDDSLSTHHHEKTTRPKEENEVDHEGQEQLEGSDKKKNGISTAAKFLIGGAVVAGAAGIATEVVPFPLPA